MISFESHIELLQLLLVHREAIVERLQAVLDAQHKPVKQLQDRAQLARRFEDCFFMLPAVSRDQAALRGELQQAHWAGGFRPRDMPGIPNEMFDPADMMARAFDMWRHIRWPGRNGRVRFAQTLFNLYVVRCLTLLDMRIWDRPGDEPAARLVQIQAVLDALWRTSPPDQPVLVRDARWLIPVAQSPTTDDLGAYFEVAAKVASLPWEDRLTVQRAAVVMAGGHLRSQLRYFNMRGTPLGDGTLVMNTRRTNALDFAMTVQGLVTLLDAYGKAVESGDAARRCELGGVICQGVSADPELFVNRIDLLHAYSMIQHLFLTTDGHGQAVLCAMGERHVGLLRQYRESMQRLAPQLAADCPRYRPVNGMYSPYGVIFGFSSNLLEHMAMKALQPEAETRFSLEDVFADAGPDANRLAWVSGWRRLPHVDQQVQALYEYPQQFAGEIFARIEAAFERRAAGAAVSAPPTGRIHLVRKEQELNPAVQGIPELSAQYIVSSDPQLVDMRKARWCDQHRLLLDRNEGEFLLSYQTPGGWTAISKDVLTAILGAGRDVRISGLPEAAASALELMATGLLASAT